MNLAANGLIAQQESGRSFLAIICDARIAIVDVSAIESYPEGITEVFNPEGIPAISRWSRRCIHSECDRS